MESRKISSSTLLSVIVPIYNAEKSIDKCVKSIVGQTYNDLEIILINDGSTDLSLEYILKWENRDSRIKIIDQINSGVSVARKRGIDCATGKYITFVDADDYLDCKMYQELMSTADKYDCDIVECGFTIVDSKNSIIDNTIPCSYNSGKSECMRNYLENLSNGIYLWNKVYKKSMFEDLGLKHLNYSEDFLWNIFIHGKCLKKITLGKSYYYYLKNNNGACGQSANIKKMDILTAGEEAYKFLSREFNDLKQYAIKYIMDNCKNLYFEMKCSALDRQIQCRQIVSIYKKYYDIKAVRNISSIYNCIGLYLFKLSPIFYCYINKIYLECKYKSKDK